jgi:O6-methylguanine-DNA--protein-cysteine methyltransferase
MNTEAQSMNTFCHVDSPIGRLLLTSDGKALTGLFTNPSRKAHSTDGWEEDAGIEPLAETARQLNEYFAGTRREFDLPLRLQGTEFQKRVWQELTEIPYGTTWSWTAGETARKSQCVAGGGAGEWAKSHFHSGALSPGDRRRRISDRLRRWVGAQTLAADA